MTNWWTANRSHIQHHIPSNISHDEPYHKTDQCWFVAAVAGKDDGSWNVSATLTSPDPQHAAPFQMSPSCWHSMIAPCCFGSYVDEVKCRKTRVAKVTESHATIGPWDDGCWNDPLLGREVPRRPGAGLPRCAAHSGSGEQPMDKPKQVGIRTVTNHH